MPPPGRRSIAFLTRAGRDRRGVSAVEFALIAPLMIAMYFGLTELCQGFMAQKRMAHAASTIADLVSQTTVVNRDDLTDVFSIGGLIMKPFSPQTLTAQVSSVTVDPQNVARVTWSMGSTMDANGVATLVDGLEPGTAVTIPANVLVEGESLIMTETTYKYATPVRYVMEDLTTFTSRFYLRPRRVDNVLCTDCPAA